MTRGSGDTSQPPHAPAERLRTRRIRLPTLRKGIRSRIHVRPQCAAPVHHRWRQQLRANQLLAPGMVLASRIIDGPNPLRPNSIAVSDVRAVLLGGELFDAAELDRMRATTEERITEHERRSE